MIPEAMQAPSADRVFMLQPGIGYIRVAAFEESTGLDIQAAIEKLGGQNLLSSIFAATGSYRILFLIGSVTLLIGCVFDLLSSRHTVAAVTT